MVVLSKIKFNQIRDLIELSYEGDDELIRNYPAYINREFNDVMTKEYAVNIQMIMIKDAENELPGEINYYKVLLNDMPIGYVVTFKDVLYSFAINKLYRKPEILKSFFDAICKVLPQKFGCVLYKGNTPAINWLIRCGLLQEENTDQKSITLVKL